MGPRALYIFDSFSAGTGFRRQNPSSKVGLRTESVHAGPAIKHNLIVFDGPLHHLFIFLYNVVKMKDIVQKTRDVYLMLFLCWASVVTLAQYQPFLLISAMTY